MAEVLTRLELARSHARLSNRVEELEEALQALRDDFRDVDWYHVDYQVQLMVEAALAKKD